MALNYTPTGGDARKQCFARLEYTTDPKGDRAANDWYCAVCEIHPCSRIVRLANLPSHANIRTSASAPYVTTVKDLKAV